MSSITRALGLEVLFGAPMFETIERMRQALP